jgi:hypothetical protein
MNDWSASEYLKRGQQMDWIKNIFDGGIFGVFKTIGDTVGNLISKPQDKLKLQQTLAEADLALKRLAFEAESAYLRDRQSARELYATDSKWQKLYAMTFLIGYMLITMSLLIVVVGWVGALKLVIPEWASLLVGSIFGAMSEKVSTITDFFFGSSLGSHNKDESVAQAVRKIRGEG